MKQLLYNAIIINRGEHYKGFIEIDNDIISAVTKGDPTEDTLQKYGKEAINIQGHWLIPGVIDSHVHFRDPGLTYKADIASESKAAIAGGVTSFFDMPNTKPPTLSMNDVEHKMEIAQNSSFANYAFYIGASSDNLEELKNADYTMIPGIKLFLGSSTGNMCVSDPEILDNIFKLPHIISVHCEDEKIINENVKELKSIFNTKEVPISWHPIVRSEMACYKSTAAAVERAKRYGTHLHICHLSTAEELKLIKGLHNITAEVCIPHLWFSDSDYAELGSRIKCNPAVKSDRHRKALREALNSGEINIVSTDHAPHTLAEKIGDLFSVPSGMPMIQFSLRAMMKIAQERIVTPERVVELMCHNQADIFHIKGRGYLDKGCFADVVEIDPNHTSVVSDNDVISKCGWTPMNGTELSSTIQRVWVNGNIAYDNGSFSDKSSAMPLKFNS